MIRRAKLLIKARKKYDNQDFFSFRRYWIIYLVCGIEIMNVDLVCLKFCKIAARSDEQIQWCFLWLVYNWRNIILGYVEFDPCEDLSLGVFSCHDFKPSHIQ